MTLSLGYLDQKNYGRLNSDHFICFQVAQHFITIQTQCFLTNLYLYI